MITFASATDLLRFCDYSKLEAAAKCIEICRDREERFDRVFGQAAARLIAKDIAQEFGLTIADGTASGSPAAAPDKSSAPMVDSEGAQ